MKKLAVVIVVAGLCAGAADLTYPDVLNAFSYRNLGPFRAGAWVIGVAVPEKPAKAHAHTFYAAARTGGVWKTTNSGITFENVTDGQGINSVGAVAVAPSNADVVWVGSGDNTVTRSAYYGNGVYKSTDGGKTWQNMGLKDSQHISRIVIHPTNPDVVWVAAVGHLFTPNTERGVFKTTDGGRTWKRVLYLKDTVGAIDMVGDPGNPNVLYAAMYEYMRHPWHLDDGGPDSGIFKSTDAGDNWKKLEGGLPKGKVGRIGIDICRSHPNTLYAVVDNFNEAAPGAQPQGGGRGGRGGGGSRTIGGEVYRTDDSGATWRHVSNADVSRKAGYSFNQLRVDPNDTEKVYITGSSMVSTADGGKTWVGLGQGGETVFRRAFGDFRSLWIDPADSDHMIATSDGGVFVSFDGGRTCDHLFNLKLGEIYAIGIDMESPYNLYAGLQDHENWKGPVNGPSGEVGIEDWKTTGTGDGMYNEPDPAGRYLYNTHEFGHPARVDMQMKSRTDIAPSREQGQPYLRFNWVAPIRISPHDGKVIYLGAQVLFRSNDRGDTWKEISPDLTTNDAGKVSPPNGSIQFCTITTISESPAQAGVIWVGADDGKVQVTRDTGAHWTDVTAKIAASGGPEDAWVSRVYASRLEPGTAYVTKTRRRFDDYRPFVFRTTDFGATWTNISKGLASAANAIVEDTVKSNLLFVGLDTGVAVSFDRGATWAPFQANMPVVPVTDLLVHPRDADLIAGTYGRGLWVAHIGALREMGGDFLTRDAVLFPIASFAQRQERAWGNYRLYGERYPITQNDINGMSISYFLKAAPAAAPSIEITSSSGASVWKTDGGTKAGVNRVIWGAGGGRGGGRGGAAGPAMKPGEYIVTLTVGGKAYTQKVTVVSVAQGDSPTLR
jgi:photosystem II stability/assembly factor-like uncharacterized protein